MTNDIISLPIRRDADMGEIDRVISPLVSKFHVSAMLLDEADDDGNCQLQLFTEDAGVVRAVTDEVAWNHNDERNTP